MGPNRPLSVYLDPFINTTTNVVHNLTINGLLGIRTLDRKMVGTDESTELWRPPSKGFKLFSSRSWVYTLYHFFYAQVSLTKVGLVFIHFYTILFPVVGTGNEPMTSWGELAGKPASQHVTKAVALSYFSICGYLHFIWPDSVPSRAGYVLFTSMLLLLPIRLICPFNPLPR